MMRIFLLIFILLTGLSFAGFFFKSPHPHYERLQTGDLVFQELGGPQGRAVRAATGSPYTHCGVVFNENGVLYVLEAVQPVSVTTLEEFRNRSRVFHARRLKNPAPLNPESLRKALHWGRKQLGQDYDPLFQWDDESLYCSELVWKIYQKAAGIELCEPKTFRSYFLEKPEVREIIRQRYGDVARLPLQEPVVAPSDLAASPLLVEVPRHR